MPDLSDAARPVDDLLDLLDGGRLVLLGEATHGSQEFYEIRAELTRRLIAERGFRGVAVEADSSAAARVNRYVRRVPGDNSASEALGDFVRFPQWTWRNQVVVELVEWLREHGTAGFYGLDLGDHRKRSWNLRDTHMADTLDALHEQLGGAGVVVWAHNSHVGDARSTEMGEVRDELSLGQLARERHGDAVRIVGFTTHAGTVTAARDFGAPAERWQMTPGFEGSFEWRLHDAGIERGVLDLRSGLLAEPLPQRMIGIVYRPEIERIAHYVIARAAQQFDIVCHVDETTALVSDLR
jgi:erythromycin esterase-like protein